MKHLITKLEEASGRGTQVTPDDVDEAIAEIRKAYAAFDKVAYPSVTSSLTMAQNSRGRDAYKDLVSAFNKAYDTKHEMMELLVSVEMELRKLKKDLRNGGQEIPTMPMVRR